MNRLVKFGILLALVAWYFNYDVPEGCSQPWKLKAKTAINKIGTKVCFTLDSWGIKPAYETIQYLLDYSRRGQANVTIPDDMNIIDLKFDGVKVSLYYRKYQLPRSPGLVFFHGGGWFLDDVIKYDFFMMELLKRVDNIVIMSVEYRKTPGVQFPAPLDDCVKATQHFINGAGEYYLDPNRVAIAGDSAGGQLAAAVALKLRDTGFKPMPKLQIIIYGTLQPLDLQLPSYQQLGSMPTVNPHDIAYCWSLYMTGTNKYTKAISTMQHTTPEIKQKLAETYLKHDLVDKEYYTSDYQEPKLDYGDDVIWNELKDKLMDPYLVPLMAEDLSGLPEALILTVHDALRDDGIIYGKRLEAAGVKVRHVHEDRLVHGMCNSRDFPVESWLCHNIIANFIKEKLE